MIGRNDLWIDAQASAAGLTLVANNEREFRRVRGLKVQKWAGAEYVPAHSSPAPCLARRLVYN
jgi:tRNA(fMet)-specific endonuclease VapC